MTGDLNLPDIGPCPFCQSFDLKLYIADYAIVGGAREQPFIASVMCNRCKAMGPAVAHETRQEAGEELILRWNAANKATTQILPLMHTGEGNWRPRTDTEQNA